MEIKDKKAIPLFKKLNNHNKPQSDHILNHSILNEALKDIREKTTHKRRINSSKKIRLQNKKLLFNNKSTYDIPLSKNYSLLELIPHKPKVHFEEEVKKAHLSSNKKLILPKINISDNNENEQLKISNNIKNNNLDHSKSPTQKEANKIKNYLELLEKVITKTNINIPCKNNKSIQILVNKFISIASNELDLFNPTLTTQLIESIRKLDVGDAQILLNDSDTIKTKESFYITGKTFEKLNSKEVSENNTKEKLRTILNKITELSKTRQEVFFLKIKDSISKIKSEFSTLVQEQRKEILTLITGKAEENLVNNESFLLPTSNIIIPDSYTKSSKPSVVELNKTIKTIKEDNNISNLLETINKELNDKHKGIDFFEYQKNKRNKNSKLVLLGELSSKNKLAIKSIKNIRREYSKNRNISLSEYQKKVFDIGKLTLSKESLTLLKNQYIDMMDSKEAKKSKVKSRWDVLAENIRSYAPQDLVDTFKNFDK